MFLSMCIITGFFDIGEIKGERCRVVRKVFLEIEYKAHSMNTVYNCVP
jgi:hypothetical protein